MADGWAGHPARARFGVDARRTRRAVVGDVGLGRSGFLDPLLRRAEETGCAMVRIVGAESMATVPFAPFVDLLPVSHG